MKLGKLLAGLLALTSGVALAADEHPAQTMVQEGTETVLEILTTHSERIKSDTEFLRETIRVHVEPQLDLVTMTKLAIGKNWRKASKAQRTELVTQFRLLLLNTYSNALTQYSGQKINFLPYRKNKREDRAVVRSEFQQTGGAAIPIAYKLRDKGGWRIYDISIDGISLVTNYRTSFSSKIKANGIEGLLDELRTKNAST